MRRVVLSRAVRCRGATAAAAAAVAVATSLRTVATTTTTSTDNATTPHAETQQADTTTTYTRATLFARGDAASSADATTTTTASSRRSRSADVFGIRKAPVSLYEHDMHSNTLSDHPLTHRASRDELSYRTRQLTERGQFERAARSEAEAAARDRDGRAGAETREYYWAAGCAVLGYLLAHSLVYRYYYPDDVRFDYAPDRGYMDDVAARRARLCAVDELVGLTVLEAVYDAQKTARKRRADAAVSALA